MTARLGTKKGRRRRTMGAMAVTLLIAPTKPVETQALG